MVERETELFNYDPIPHYIQELKQSFGDIALFLYDELGGDTIAVVWKPKAFLPQPMKISQMFCRTPVILPSSIADQQKKQKKQGDQVVMLVPNILEIVSSFKKIGEGLVESVQVN